ncbi:Uma2 family endonuclease [Fuerstiella marisgermanici]|uniref:Putative restriction endonuclease domain-containing protein n=1 Tax=Fuerstiella marisgermanici TaxID=1891926 RepID=A0A1P8WHL7_9PLAN|nr:Uma2 family endonuclease [Fuerstiella marisgermanici]APZ93550.1 hypothetical protein Fuma_03168 [Fuerstiella marisgermanici]
MLMDTRMTAEEFARRKNELPDGGRWHELHEGQPVVMEAPDDSHGNAVLNLSRALAEWFKARTEQSVGYACHEIGLKVASEPDTVLCPAISFFDSGQQFEETEKMVADQLPKLVIDIASANDRRQEMRRRTLFYMDAGVKTVWVPDPMKKEVQVIGRGNHTLSLGEWQTLDGGESLVDFRLKVSDIFVQPEWWTGR